MFRLLLAGILICFTYASYASYTSDVLYYDFNLQGSIDGDTAYLEWISFDSVKDDEWFFEYRLYHSTDGNPEYSQQGNFAGNNINMNQFQIEVDVSEKYHHFMVCARHETQTVIRPYCSEPLTLTFEDYEQYNDNPDDEIYGYEFNLEISQGSDGKTHLEWENFNTDFKFGGYKLLYSRTQKVPDYKEGNIIPIGGSYAKNKYSLQLNPDYNFHYMRLCAVGHWPNNIERTRIFCGETIKYVPEYVTERQEEQASQAGVINPGTSNNSSTPTIGDTASNGPLFYDFNLDGSIDNTAAYFSWNPYKSNIRNEWFFEYRFFYSTDSYPEYSRDGGFGINEIDNTAHQVSLDISQQDHYFMVCSNHETETVVRTYCSEPIKLSFSQDNLEDDTVSNISPSEGISSDEVSVDFDVVQYYNFNLQVEEDNGVAYMRWNRFQSSKGDFLWYRLLYSNLDENPSYPGNESLYLGDSIDTQEYRVSLRRGEDTHYFRICAITDEGEIYGRYCSKPVIIGEDEKSVEDEEEKNVAVLNSPSPEKPAKRETDINDVEAEKVEESQNNSDTQQQRVSVQTETKFSQNALSKIEDLVYQFIQRLEATDYSNDQKVEVIDTVLRRLELYSDVERYTEIIDIIQNLLLEYRAKYDEELGGLEEIFRDL